MLRVVSKIQRHLPICNIAAFLGQTALTQTFSLFRREFPVRAGHQAGDEFLFKQRRLSRVRLYRSTIY